MIEGHQHTVLFNDVGDGVGERDAGLKPRVAQHHHEAMGRPKRRRAMYEAGRPGSVARRSNRMD